MASRARTAACGSATADAEHSLVVYGHCKRRAQLAQATKLARNSRLQGRSLSHIPLELCAHRWVAIGPISHETAGQTSGYYRHRGDSCSGHPTPCTLGEPSIYCPAHAVGGRSSQSARDQRRVVPQRGGDVGGVAARAVEELSLAFYLWEAA